VRFFHPVLWHLLATGGKRVYGPKFFLQMTQVWDRGKKATSQDGIHIVQSFSDWRFCVSVNMSGIDR